MIKKKAVALTLLTTVGIGNSATLALEVKADEKDNEAKEVNEESTFTDLTQEEKDKLNVEVEDEEFNLIEEKTINLQRALSLGTVINVSSSLRIRENANTSSNIKGTLKNGNTFNIESFINGWYKINYNGVVGYVHGDYVKVIDNNNNESNENISNNEAISSLNGQVINVTSSLRIRAASNTTSTILGYLKANEKVTIISEDNGWYKIKSNSLIGYVSGEYIKKINSNVIESPDNNIQDIPSENKPNSNNGTSNENADGLILFKEQKRASLINVSTNLRLRNKPSTSATVLAYLLPSYNFTVEGESGSWYYINFNGKKGYAHKDYIKITDNTIDNSINSSTSVSEKYNRVLSIMKSQIGSPYVYGGAGESLTTSLLNSLKTKYSGVNYKVDANYINSGYRAFDCSGLMQWSFNEIGIKIGRSTYNQINNGVEVSLSSLKEGDLLFYSDLNHVGMYVGDGKWLESPRTGEYVRISNVPWNKVGRVRRILN